MANDIRNFIFDLGNTLVHFDPMAMTAAYVKDEAQCRIICPVVFDRLYWDALDSASITDEALKSACHNRLPPELHKLADEVYDRWLEHLPPISGMEQLLQELKNSGKKLYLLSNVSSGFAENYHRVPHLVQLFSLFDGLVFSGPLKIVKPQGEIFHHVLDTYHLKAKECLFVDDNRANIAGAEAVGIHAYLFDGNTEKLHDYLIQFIR